MKRSLPLILFLLFIWTPTFAQDTTSAAPDTTTGSDTATMDAASGFSILGPSILDTTPSIGFKLGVNQHTVQGADITGLQLRRGVHFGAYFLYPLMERLAVKAELLYSREGYRQQDGNELLFVELNYFSIPILARYHLGNGFFVEGGPSVNLLLGANHVNKQIPSAGAVSLSNGFQRFEELSSSEQDDRYNSLDVGAELGFGYTLASGWEIGVRGDMGFMDLLADPPEERSNFSGLGGRLSIAKTF